MILSEDLYLCSKSAIMITPGLTKVPIDGQPASIVQELDDMARQYIKGDNAIILAVTPANADLATSDALRMAREVCCAFRVWMRNYSRVELH